MAALHLDNLLFLLFVALAIFFQILTRAATKGRRRPGDTTPRSTSPSQMSRPLSGDADDATDEQRIRKFLEALGQPTTSKPPAPVAPRPTYQRPVVLPHVSPMKSPLPPLKTRPPDLPREVVREDALPAERVSIIKTAAPEAYAIASQPISKSAGEKIDLATMLKSTSGLRDAIILREIFGPPRSLQPLDLVGSV
jgi:hypothetical protein